MQRSSSDEQIEVEKKQCFLREQIIDNGHDPEEFAQFLNEALPIGSDLSQCSMGQLESVVQKFIENRFDNSSSFTLNRTDTKDPDKKICEKIESQTQPKKIFFKNSSYVSEEQFSELQKCVKVHLRYPNSTGFTCQVSNPQRKNVGGIMGIGGTSFLVFRVRVHGLQKEPVERRYSDFQWLRSTLTKFYPSHVIPPIPDKKASKRTALHIQKRMRILSMFMNDILKMPVILNNHYVENFIMLKDSGKFEKLKEEGESKKAYETISSAETLSGKVKVELSETTLNFKDCLVDLVPEVEKLYKEITRNSKKVKGCVVDQINTLFQMGNQFGDLHELATKFNRVVKTEECQKMSKIYVALNNMMVEWGNSLKNSVEDMEKNIITFFKYMREEFMGFHELLRRESLVEAEFLREKENLDRQKEKIFLLHDFKKWGIPKSEIDFIPKSALNHRDQAYKMMLPKESVAVEKLKKTFGYYLSETYINGSQNFSRAAERFCENFKQFSIKMKVSNQQIGAMWMEMSAKFSDPYQSNNGIQKMENWDEISELQSMMHDE